MQSSVKQERPGTNSSENLIYLAIWLTVLALPIFTLRGFESFNWNRALLEWTRFVPFLIIFAINNSLLVPRLLFKKKNALYLLYLTITVLAVVLLSDSLRGFNDAMNPNFQPPPLGRPEHLPMKEPGRFVLGGRMIDKVIISFLVVGFNTAIKFVFKRQEEEALIEEQKKIQLQTELALLRQQISPHFFMNTLNNIHALIDIEKEQAKEAVIKLSKLMRYLLSESQKGTATIQDEFEFLNSYIGLMRLRYSDKVNIDVRFNVEDAQKKIPSLLFVSLVENAFKYGVSYSKPSSISILAHDKNGRLFFEVKNSKWDTKKQEASTGVGLENLRKQLELLFVADFSLNIAENETEFNVELQIPLTND